MGVEILSLRLTVLPFAAAITHQVLASGHSGLNESHIIWSRFGGTQTHDWFNLASDSRFMGEQ